MWWFNNYVINHIKYKMKRQIFFNINIPVSFDIIIFQKIKNKNELTIILYNKIYSITLLGDKTILRLDLESYSLGYKLLDFNPYNNIANKNINYFLNTFEKYFFVKIKFKGKGFKVKFFKKIKLIKFFFGRSHITFYKLKKIKLKKINKYKFLLKSLNFNKVMKTAFNITQIKPVNFYTLRGIRISRQFIKKRKGKKSNYI